MEKILMYRAKDGTVFTNEFDCKEYERETLIKENECMKQMRFFNGWGGLVERYDPMKVEFVYIPEKLFEEAQTIFLQFHRTLKSYSSNNLYTSYNMELKPVNYLLEKKEARLKEARREFDETIQLIDKIIKKINK